MLLLFMVVMVVVEVVVVVVVGSGNTKEYKEITNSNSRTGPNEAVFVATLYYYYICMSETERTTKWKASLHLSIPLDEAGRKWKRYQTV